MKNLPNKIYLNFGECSKQEFDEADFHDLFSEEVTWSEDDVQGRNVEYVREDAFIEKAIEWLQDNIMPFNDDDVEDFKNYMEGE